MSLFGIVYFRQSSPHAKGIKLAPEAIRRILADYFKRRGLRS